MTGKPEQIEAIMAHVMAIVEIVAPESQPDAVLLAHVRDRIERLIGAQPPRQTCASEQDQNALALAVKLLGPDANPNALASQTRDFLAHVPPDVVERTVIRMALANDALESRPQ